jgi:hypothetical protein
MNPVRVLLAITLVGLVVSCGGGGNRDIPGGSASAAPADGATGVVPARANIFGAGRETPPAPGGGGGGVLPPAWRLPAGSAGVMTFPSVTGRVNPISGVAEFVGPDAGKFGTTDISSHEGISGIIHRRKGMFLVGVFLTDSPPPATAPPRLDFTDRENFDVLSPEIGQTFLIGDGKGRSYRAPAGATRLFLGFADGHYYKGDPGWYDNNVGELTVTVNGADRSVG